MRLPSGKILEGGVPDLRVSVDGKHRRRFAEVWPPTFDLDQRTPRQSAYATLKAQLGTETSRSVCAEDRGDAGRRRGRLQPAAGAEEERTLARLRALRNDLIDPTIAIHNGRLVKRTGDGAVVEFRSVVEAVRSAIEVQAGIAERNAGLPADNRIEVRVGIHLGDVVEEADGDLMGDGVNIPSRLEGMAKPGGICLSQGAYEQVRDKVKEEFDNLGEQNLKNIARPMRVMRSSRSRSLEGSVQRRGDRIRVNVQLVDAGSGNHLWAEQFDKPVADFFDMQYEIVARLANELDSELVFEARRLD